MLLCLAHTIFLNLVNVSFLTISTEIFRVRWAPDNGWNMLLYTGCLESSRWVRSTRWETHQSISRKTCQCLNLSTKLRPWNSWIWTRTSWLRISAKCRDHSPTNALFYLKKHVKIYIKIHINIASTCFGLRSSSGSLHWTWLKLYLC